MGDSIVPNTNISFSVLRDKWASASPSFTGDSDPGNQTNVSLSEFRGATFTDGTTVPTGSTAEISINDDFKGKTFGTTSSSSLFKWHYYAYGSSIGAIYIYWLKDGGSLVQLNSISGQQHTGSTQSWNNYEEDLYSARGETGRIVIAYKAGSNYLQDIQLDNMELTETTSGDIDLDPGTSSTTRNSWQKNNSFTTTLTYPTSQWNTLSTSISISTSASNRWNYDSGGTPSGSTGGTKDADGSSTGYYLYFEGSYPNYSSSNRYYWVRMGTSYTLSGGGGGDDDDGGSGSGSGSGSGGGFE